MNQNWNLIRQDIINKFRQRLERVQKLSIEICSKNDFDRGVVRGIELTTERATRILDDTFSKIELENEEIKR